MTRSAELKSSSLGGIRTEVLKGIFDILQQPSKGTPDGIILSPRSERTGWLTYGLLADEGIDPAAFSDLYIRLDPRVDRRLRFDAIQAITVKKAARRWLEAGDFGQLAYKALEMASPDERHLWLREIVLPEFFAKYPSGKVAYVTYAAPVRKYLHLLNVL